MYVDRRLRPSVSDTRFDSIRSDETVSLERWDAAQPVLDAARFMHLIEDFFLGLQDSDLTNERPKVRNETFDPLEQIFG